MPAKDIEFKDAARKRIVAGANLVANAARVTLGPLGRNVLIERSFGSPTITKDGAAVVKEIELEDHFENLGARMIREAASKTADDAGDGTTTATVLADAIVREGLKLVAAGAAPIEVARGIAAGVDKVVEEIRATARPVKNRAHMEQIATISANGDSVIGSMVASAMDKVGKEGVITVEEARGLNSELELVEGLRFDRGYLSPYFITNAEKQTVELEEPLILLHEKKLSTMRELIGVLEHAARSGRSLLIIAEDVEAEALTALVVNKLRGTLKVAAVKAPGFGDRRKEMLQDMAILTGGTLIAEELGEKLENVQPKQLGKCKRVLIDRDGTALVGGAGEKAQISGRIEQIRRQAQETTSDYDRDKLEERLARLTGGVAIIKAGAATEVELKEKKARVDDAVHALKAAVEEGTVAGGGVALIRAIGAVRNLRLKGDQKSGAKILADAIDEPLRQIAENAGYEPGIVSGKVAQASGDLGFNARTGSYENLVKAGVVDPAKVVRVALQNAASVASMVLTSEAAVAEQPQKSTAPFPTPPGGGMGGMGGMGGEGF